MEQECLKFECLKFREHCTEDSQNLNLKHCRYILKVIKHLSKPIGCTAPRVNPNVNYGLQVIMMWQCRFINRNKCTTQAGDVDNGGGCAHVEVGGIWEISVPSAQLCCEPKTALKNKVYFFKKSHSHKAAHSRTLVFPFLSPHVLPDQLAWQHIPHVTLSPPPGFPSIPSQRIPVLLQRLWRVKGCSGTGGMYGVKGRDFPELPAQR